MCLIICFIFAPQSASSYLFCAMSILVPILAGRHTWVAALRCSSPHRRCIGPAGASWSCVPRCDDRHSSCVEQPSLEAPPALPHALLRACSSSPAAPPPRVLRRAFVRAQLTLNPKPYSVRAQLTLWGGHTSDPGSNLEREVAGGGHPILAVKSCKARSPIRGSPPIKGRLPSGGASTVSPHNTSAVDTASGRSSPDTVPPPPPHDSGSAPL